MFNAGVAAGSPTGFWRMSAHPAVQQALRNHSFDSLGLPRLHVSAPSLTWSNRRGTDPYARWWGRGGAARCPPYPDQCMITIDRDAHKAAAFLGAVLAGALPTFAAAARL